MRFSTAVLVSIFTAITASASCSYEGGNYFCSNVDAITYENVGYSGTYKDVTNMDETTCQCSQESVSFSGSNSPLDEQLSVHFRGPLRLLQFGFYSPSSTSSKKKRDLVEEDCSTTKHIHHAHKREPATQIVAVTETVYVNADGEVVTQNTQATSQQTTTTLIGGTAAGTASSQNTANTANTVSTVNTNTATTASPTTTGTTSTSSTSSTSATATSTAGTDSAWVRSSYYTPGSTDNCVFLNTLGGSSSGVFSTCFGNSLSYCSADGSSAASSAQALNDVLLTSDQEYAIFSGEACSGSSCGYYRSGIPAYEGFGGSEKIFVFEFEMPHEDGASGSNPDMPAIWLLNAKIPRTLQYGDATCSCWSTGCGELDLFEVLLEGDERLISHLHDGQGNDGTSYGGGGSQDYFTRPTSGSMKGAVIFSGSSITLVKLDDSTTFGSGLSADTVNEWLATEGAVAQLV
ncbi:TOS1 [Cyberlindnera jadinii]|uniref:glucan endo-1,3-beta-D-glucosidase n=1 Tax=Cyberlindnera jadinii (strain ATCC 18201 / CBS 1600 / BCRC 20928 / JCM 3617 / NBRC 0987 / NRRL Y-1542) TaxID=983966 RepID=A0A0H5C357_CYBJN|nr:TOS1 [Cyberlindnera jadinii]